MLTDLLLPDSLVNLHKCHWLTFGEVMSKSVVYCFFRLTVYNMKRTTRSQHGRLINTTVKYARHILSNYS